ncbi:filamentous hemagglutinin N-terminal domain-containing protein [[Phormidium] sp. ETS-05]|uniref:two-partner secretion domain-containing protein n=1 Tax=[Phormidium] sp. ETS-05 TaxID=222819 RepID=UPI0018EF3074|nr:filamentous hemagglutinin N-terminal domain-containing protein [[Phormidium] sp. ETS-05]
MQQGGLTQWERWWLITPFPANKRRPILIFIGFLCWGVSVLWPVTARGQITPDRTLGAESSTVNQANSNSLEIEIGGGATRGVNLFHSFQEFNIDTEQTVNFTNTATIENIITRVTGGNPSNINGTLGVVGTANLFFLNPNGIIFGNNANLNINGSFIATTASSIVFENGLEFSATNPQAAPLLTVNVPLGLQFGANPGPIAILPSATSPDMPFLYANQGKTLGFVGGDLTFQSGNIYAPQGRIELGAVGDNSYVTLNHTDNSWQLGYEDVTQFRDIHISGMTKIGAEPTLFTTGNGGSIAIWANNLRLQDSSEISASTFSQGNAGDIYINAANSIVVSTDSGIFAQVNPTGRGNAGSITIDTRHLRIENGGQVATKAFVGGNAGDLTVNASDAVEVIGFSMMSGPSSLFTDTLSSGNAGNLTINTGRLIIDTAQVRSETLGAGSGGNLTVNAREYVEVRGRFDAELPASLTASTEGSGDSQNLTINTPVLRILDGATVSARSRDPGSGNAGDITINASEIQVSGSQFGEPSTLRAETLTSGNAGSINITANLLSVKDGGEVTVSSRGTGQTGNLQINVGNIRLRDGGSLRATSVAGDRGNITINSSNLWLQTNSAITATATEQANGGNITIGTDTLLVLDMSRIDANAVTGNGGNIDINTTADIRSFDSSITASSELGIDGEVIIQTPEIDPIGSLLTVDTNPVDAASLIARGCNVEGDKSRFAYTGTGGVPPSPSDNLLSDIFWDDMRPLVAQTGTTTSQEPRQRQLTATVTSPIIEAQGWVYDKESGEIILTADIYGKIDGYNWQPNVSCDGRVSQFGAKVIESK